MRVYPEAIRPTLGRAESTTLMLSGSDFAASRYLHVPIEIPAGASRLDVTWTYEKDQWTLIDFGILDSKAVAFPTTDGFRGWSGGARDSFFVATDAATPGYVPGEMTAGRWHLLLGLVRLPEHQAPLTVTVQVSDAGGQPHSAKPVAPARRGGAGWYKGDCHSHTFHSDAKGSPETLHQQAIEANLDFLFVTDHNTMTAWPAYFEQASSPDLVFIPGMEVTTSFGHGNVLGPSQWVDFRLEREEDPDRLVQQAHAAGGLFSINHDKVDLPWLFPVPEIDCMEVWQRNWLVSNHLSLARYDGRLRRGKRVTAIGGSDFHQPTTLESNPILSLGVPTTVLYCDELSQSGVLTAMSRGQGYVTESMDGPKLIQSLGEVAMGGVLPRSDGETLSVEISGAEGDDLVLIGDRGEIARQPIGSPDWSSRFDLPPGLQFVRSEIQAISSQKRLLDEARVVATTGHPTRELNISDASHHPIRRAISNPIYFGDWR